MPDCPHNHIQDSGLQAFREIIREKTDGGNTIVDFLNDAAEGNLPKFEPHHRIQASEILVRYGFKGADEPAKQHNDSQPKPVLSSVEGTPSANRSRSAPGAPALNKPRPEHSRRADDRDPAVDDFAQTIRDQTENGLTIVRNLVHIMETHEEPYKPHHNLRAARRLIENGFPLTDALLCSPDCSHHAPAHPEPIEGDDSESEEFVPDPGWVKTLHEIKRMEDEGIIDKVEYDPFKPMYNWAPKEVVLPYADEIADKFRAKLDLQAERRANWPEIEERRRKKLEQIYPSHSEDEDGETPDT